MVGSFQIMAGLARLGGLVSFVSHSVITAFTAAAGLLIAVSQIPDALGISVAGGGNVVVRILRVVDAAPDVIVSALLIAGVTLATVVIIQTFAPKLPGFLIAIAAGSGLAPLIDADEKGVEMLGEIPAALPSFHVPTLSFVDITQLAPGATAIALVGLLEAITIGRTFAIRRQETFMPNQEILGQGLSNLIGGFFQSYAGSGSFTRSGINAEAGAKTPLATIIASILLATVLVFWGSYITLIPKPAMAGLILYVAWRLIDFREIKHVLTHSWSESLILVLTLIAGLVLELDFAIYVGVISSFSVFIYESAHPSLRVSAPVVMPSGQRKFRNSDLHHIPECPQIVTVRLDGSLYFGSVKHVEAEWKALRAKRQSQKHVIFYLKGVGKIDLSGADFLTQVIREVREAGGSFHIVALFPPLLECLRRFHIIEQIGPERLHASKGEALTAAMTELDSAICAQCDKRIYLECENMPASLRPKNEVTMDIQDMQLASPCARPNRTASK